MFGETEQKTEILNQGVFITKIGLSVFRYYIKSIIHSFKIINSDIYKQAKLSAISVISSI